MPAGRTPVRLSVVIATYNRAEHLDACLRHLLAQPVDEVVVADNASTDGTAAVVIAHQSTAVVPVRYVYVQRPGKSFALQQALEVASGEMLAFIDDDVLVDEKWSWSIRDVMSDPAVVLAGGPVIPRWERPAPGWLQIGEGPYGRLAAPIALLHYGDQADDLGERTLLGANLVIRRTALEALGGFATHLGKLRGTLLSGEDADLCDRVRQHGWKAIYWPPAVVRHWVPASRMCPRYYASWFFWSGITHAARDRDAAAPARRVFGLPMWLGRQGIAACAAGIAGVVRGRVTDIVHAMADATFVLGYAARSWGLVRTGTPAARSSEGPS